MIKLTLRLGGDLSEIIVRGNELLFSDTSSGVVTTLEGLRLSKAGVLKEHPDLKDDRDWKLKAIKRLKAHVKKMKTEMEKIEYVKDEFTKFGYSPIMKQRAGHRPVRYKQ